MFLTLPYVALAKILILNGEITKNIFTLYQVQKKKLKDRRKKLANEKEKDQKSKFRQYFADQKEDEGEEEKQVKPSMRYKSMETVIGDRPNIKKKKKKYNQSYSEDINDENRKNEEDDQTSESSDDSTESSGDDIKSLK